MNNKGFALLSTLVTAAVMSVMAVVIISTALDLQRASQNTLAQQRAFNATDAAIVRESLLGMPCVNSGWSLTSSFHNLPDLGSNYNYDATIQRIDLPLEWMPPGQATGRNCILPPEVPGGLDRPDRLYLLQIEGRWRDARSDLHVVLQADSIHENFRVISWEQR